jgi:hypothetical protein
VKDKERLMALTHRLSAVTYNNKLSVTANSRLCNPARALQGALGYLTGELD